MWTVRDDIIQRRRKKAENPTAREAHAAQSRRTRLFLSRVIIAIASCSWNYRKDANILGASCGFDFTASAQDSLKINGIRIKSFVSLKKFHAANDNSYQYLFDRFIGLQEN